MARKSAYATVARTRLFDTMLCTVYLVRPSCIPLWPTCQFYAGTTGFMVVITASLGACLLSSSSISINCSMKPNLRLWTVLTLSFSIVVSFATSSFSLSLTK